MGTNLDNFKCTLNPLCPGNIKPEATMHFFLCCYFYIVICANIMSDLLKIDSSLPTENDEKLLDILLYSNSRFNKKKLSKYFNLYFKINLLKTHTYLTTSFSKVLVFFYFASCFIYDNALIFYCSS